MLQPVRLIVVALTGICALVPRAVAQQVMGVTPATPGPVVKVESAPTQPGPGAEPGKSERRRLGPDGKPMGEPGKPSVEPRKEAKPGDSKAEEPPSIARPAKPSKPPDPNELAVRPDAQGRLRFNFRGQPWPAVLEWLAEVSGMSLDWQELPGDFLNLSTQRAYTVRETRDLINRHLLARGYTLLTQGEVLSVVNLKKLNPGLVPRVEPEQLAARDPYEFVKVSFPLDWMVAESAVEELKPMLSPNGKLTALRATNRIEAMDAVANLREIHALLNAEQSNQGQERLVREFVLEHARATDVYEQLRALVGLEAPSGSPMRGPGGPGQPSPEMQHRMMMMVQGGPGGPQPQPQPGQPQPGAPLKARAEVYLVVNARKNSIVAVAPPDKMAILAEAVRRLDAPLDRDASLSTTMNRVHVYRLASIDPEAIVKTLEELGNLDPTTRLQVDKKNRAIVANAPPWDHVMIRAVVQKLDGSERQFEVIQLRRLPADYVAGTIEFMMGGEKPKENRRSSYYPFDFFGQDRRGQSDESQSKFRVEADVENNRLLLKANPIELDEVKQLLVKLGEMPAEAGRGSTVRTLDLPPGKETDELLERIRRRWPGIAPNPLVLPPPSEDDGEPAESPKPKPSEHPKPSADPGGKAREAKPRMADPEPPRAGAPLVAMVPIGQGVEDKADPADSPRLSEPERAWRASEPDPASRIRRGESAAAGSVAPESPGGTRQAQVSLPPVTVTRGPDGRLIVSSSDPEALDRFEDLVAQSVPASPNDFRIFKLQYAWASGVATILRDVFKEEKKEERRSPWYWDYYDTYGREGTSEKDRARLSKRRPLKILSESDTNSILVQGADATQLRQIEELIKFYDRAEPTDAQSVRKTQTFRLKHSQAKVVAETIKDVYRDLLSANDKALASTPPQRPERSFSFFLSDDSDKAEKTPKFKGLLSVGIDELSNTLVVSAPAYLMEGVSKIIEELDSAAEPVEETMTVVNLRQGAAGPQVQEALARVLGQGGSERAGRSKPGATAPRKPEPRRTGRTAESSGKRSR